MNENATKKELLQLIKKIEHDQKGRIPGSLQIGSTNEYVKYFHYYPDKEGARSKCHYLSKRDLELARQLAQQEYEAQLLNVAKRQLRILEKHPGEYDPHALQDVYMNLHEARKILVTPLVITDESYVKQWESVPYVPGQFSTNDPFIMAERGDRVRSKSEKIIADKYFRRGVPYRYEFPLTLKDGKKEVIRRPDFLVLDKRTRKEYIHEHFGKVDDPDYAQHQLLEKLELYAENGIFPGVNLLITMESSQHVFNDRYLDLLIKKYHLAE